MILEKWQRDELHALEQRFLEIAQKFSKEDEYAISQLLVDSELAEELFGPTLRDINTLEERSHQTKQSLITLCQSFQTYIAILLKKAEPNGPGH